ncbi:neuropeptide SIFamide receptor-like [Oculina patagonica]
MLNTTANGTQSAIKSSSCHNSAAARIGIIFAYCLIFVVSMAGNIFIGIIVYKTKAMRKPINFLIVNMAMSDLLFPIFLFPQIITQFYVDSFLISGPLGQALCKLVPFLQSVSLTVSILSLVLIAVDRFGAVVFPLRSPVISSKLCPFFILATWIIAMAINSSYLFVFKLVEYPGGLLCVLQWNEVFGDSWSFENYFLTANFALIVIPLVLIAILYTIIYLKLKSQTIPGEQSTRNARQQRVQRERNVLKMAIAIVLGFAVCWLPLSIRWILFLFVPDMWYCGFQYFSFVAEILGHANCAINPCICFLFSENYRQSLRNLFKCF